MGSSEAPNYEESKIYGEDREIEIPGMFGKRKIKVPGGGMQGGREAFDYAMNMMKKGLPEDLKKEYERRFSGDIAGQVRGGEQNLKERFSSMGNVPVGAMNDAYTKLRSGANEATGNFYGGMIGKDFDARQTGFGNFATLQGIANALANSKNQYNLGKFQIDEENKFKFGDFLGSLFGAGGNAFSGYLGRP
jgi:hypothetical protein